MCYCCKERCVRITMILVGFLLIIPGILLFIFGGLFAKEIKVLTNTSEGETMGKVATGITFLFAAMVLYIGLAGFAIGCCFTKCQKLSKCCACIYSIKSFIFFVVFLILGIVFLAISSGYVKYVDQYCNGTLDTSKWNDKQLALLDDIKQIEQNFASYPSKWLCTSTCPCPTATTQNWYTQYTNTTLDQTARAKFNRTTALTTTNATLTPFTLVATTSATSYDNFWDCYKNLKNLDDQAAQADSNYKKKAVELSEGFENFAREVESGLNCNGICYPGLFYYFKTIYNGPPTQNCVEGLKTAFGSKPLGIGILLLISFALTVLTHITSWAMCCRCCAAKETKDKWK